MGAIDWDESVTERLREKLPEIKPGDFRFYNLAHLPLIAKKVNEHSGSCKICRSYKENIDQMVDDLPGALTKNIKRRKKFEAQKTKIEQHLKRGHRCRFPGYYASLGSFLGFVAGFFIAICIYFLLNLSVFNKLTLIALAVFVILGRSWGAYVDRKYFNNKLQL